MKNNSNSFLKLANNKVKFGFYLLVKLPAAFFSGVRVQAVTNERAQVRLRYKWLTQNPFGSIYFASLAMAAELSTGLLAMHAVWGKQPSVSMLVFDMKAEFTKKAVGRIVFSCHDGEKIADAVAQAIQTGEGVTVAALTEGIDEQGDTVATFSFTWTFKQKTMRK